MPSAPTKGVIMLVCRKCGKKEKLGKGEQIGFTTKGSTKLRKKSSIPVIDSEKQLSKLSTIAVECPKCKNVGAIWWMVQTRGVDEPPTRFYKCIKCSHTWREFA